MSSVPYLESRMRDILETQANELARQSGFIVRQRAFSGADFAQGLVFGWWNKPRGRLVQLARALGRRDVQISASGLSQRFTPQAASFMEQLLEQTVSQVVSGPAVPLELLQRFSSVVLEDSSVIALPDELKTHWKGCGGGGSQSEAGVKLHVRLDLLHGRLQGPMLSDGRQADQRSPLRHEGIAPGGLSITDEGYFGLRWLKEATKEGNRFFLTRPRYTTAFFDRAGQRLRLTDIGPKAVHQSLDLAVVVGQKVRLEARLIMVRVPEEVAKQRRESMWQTARRHSTTPTQEQLALAQWTILITNAGPELLSVSDILILQRARWQIERLFRLWKEDGAIDEWRSSNPWRILCELYAKLIAMVIEHWVLIEQCWHDPYRSLVKAAAVIRDHALSFIDVLMGEMSLLRLMQRLARELRSGCQVDRRSKDPSLAQLLSEGLPWPLT